LGARDLHILGAFFLSVDHPKYRQICEQDLFWHESGLCRRQAILEIEEKPSKVAVEWCRNALFSMQSKEIRNG
jgi:hypothetical protein